MNTYMTIIDRYTLKEIIRITCEILRNHFFYDEELIKEFLIVFTDEFSTAIFDFGNTADDDVIYELCDRPSKRFNFTCYFASAIIRRILIHILHFSEQELQAFESVTSKYAGEQPNEKQSRRKRAHNRKFSK